MKKTWQQLVDILFAKLSHRGEIRLIPSIISFPKEAVEKVEDTIQAKEFRQTYDEAKKEMLAIASLKDKIEKQERTMLYNLFLTAGKLRAQLLQELTERGIYVQFQLNNEYFSDLFREIRLIPYRPVVQVKSFIFETREQLGGGIAGLLAFLNVLFIFSLFYV